MNDFTGRSTPDALFFDRPPEQWEHRIPLGNGRLGVMLKASPCRESLQLNEESVWSGGPQDRLNPDARKSLPAIRELVRDGRIQEAQELAFETLSGTSFNERVYQTAGDLNIDFFTEENAGITGPLPSHQEPQETLDSYSCILRLDEAAAEIRYTCGGTEFTRRVWVSAPDNMIFMHVKASESGKVNFRAFLDRGIWSDRLWSEDGMIFMKDAHGIPFCAGAGAVTSGGKTAASGVCLTGKGCDELLLFVDIRTYSPGSAEITKEEYDREILDDSWSERCASGLRQMGEFISENGVSAAAEILFGRHRKEYSEWYGRMSFSLCGTSSSDRPTPELLSDTKSGRTLTALQYCNFSRYLLISSGRKPGILPATLQGLWNGSMDPPWGSKYTININLQMNYWPACICGLQETEEAVFALLERTYRNGVRTAQEMYGCRGFALHHNTDIWGDSAPQDCWIPGTYWTLGNAWLATHIVSHYAYTRDRALLSRYYYLIHESCLFYTDFLTGSTETAEDGKPYLVLNPSVSPENSYISRAGQEGAFAEGCEMDNMILEQLFRGCLDCAAELGEDAKRRDGTPYPGSDFDEFRNVLAHIKRPELNSDGTIMEWNSAVTETEPGHRHISHLYGLFPGSTISPEETPALAAAAERTLEKRLRNGGGHTGWSQAWIMNFRASLHQGNEALSGLMSLFDRSTLPNLLDTHPPFQIDGNFGTLAAVTRMLIQSRPRESLCGTDIDLQLLPALPDSDGWRNGHLRGVRIHGGLSADLEWKDGKPVKAAVHALSADRSITLNIYKGGSDTARAPSDRLCVFHSSVVVKPGLEDIEILF